MKVLLINYTDAGGGAAIAALRLVTALNEHGVYARLGVTDKRTCSPYSFVLPQKRHFVFYRFFAKTLRFLRRLSKLFFKCIPNPFKFRTSNKILHSTNFYSETDIDWINKSDFDIVNLHWIIGTICNKDIAKIKKPIVWTMHDSWPCCGAEHHPNLLENDTRWKEGYLRHNKPQSTRGFDICRKVCNQKKRYLSNKNIVFTAPSNWEHDILNSSALFGTHECTVIPNIVDHTVFCHKDKNTLREAFNIPKNKIVLGFGAAYDIDDPKSMKGSFYLIEAFKKISNPEDYFLVIFGPAGAAFTSKVSIPFFASGYISNPNILACLYSVCDCIINPSLIENLPTTCLEALFCGVPSVAFDVGGTSDIVVHKKTGWLATPYNDEELATGIEWCSEHNEELSKNCFVKAKNDFDTNKIINDYISVYSDAIKQNNR